MLAVEALDSNCFDLLTSFLYLNELPVLRLVCRSFASRLGDPKIFAFDVRQSQAFLFPGQWYDERDVCCTRISPCETEIEHWQGQRVLDEGTVVNEKQSQLAAWPHCGSEASSCAAALGSSEEANTRVSIEHSDCGGWDQEGDSVSAKRRRQAPSFLNAYLSVRPCGLRQLSLHWSGGVSRFLCATFRRLLTAAAPTLEHLSTFGSSLAMWRSVWPLELAFPRLTRLDITNDCGTSHVRYYQDCLDWHFLTRCEFPACKELRWFDSFEWDDDDDEVLWHEIVYHQLKFLFSLLSSMDELRRLAFTADSRYTITQVLVYFASRPSCAVEELEIVPAIRNCEALDRDWLLPDTFFGNSMLDGMSKIQSVRQIRFVLNECDLCEFIQTGILALVKRMCPRGDLFLGGTVCLNMCEKEIEGWCGARSRCHGLLQRTCCEHSLYQCATSDQIKKFIQGQSITEFNFKAIRGDSPTSVTVSISRPGVRYPLTPESTSPQCPTSIPPTVSLEVARPLPRLSSCLSQHIQDITRLIPGILLRLEGDRRYMDQIVNLPGFSRNLVGLEIGLSGGQPSAPAEELLALASRYGRWQARVIRLYDIRKGRTSAGSRTNSQGALGRFLDSLLHDACPNVSVIEYRLVGPASWQRECGVQRGIPALSENMLPGFTLHQRLDYQVDGGAEAIRVGRTTGHVTVLVYRRSERHGAMFVSRSCFS
ncbi:hypothetical protein NCLIV_057300 [Neospora caninum Liverpool]|uniref:F-box domain-containing protein n=1 Tax=Neospora caninum (strain Liverpool) TaxID=572307 RepID=F0VNL1_NEOCL|nr:hypothetical protein NCLIV_057300 [Neospora caninum Liverpool]CBZ55307.1 hypothetical protein NCLIV_057300 [Neospora caninum Liverpool]CEL70039.1 TPA: hypothetical protein BN1204_057300 [Neospora caninum Liverpool]|eukprot:XP_003885335.1 hypothetical protein NCLIV_057300 [Neospora caninum Liverpool]